MFSHIATLPTISLLMTTTTILPCKWLNNQRLRTQRARQFDYSPATSEMIKEENYTQFYRHIFTTETSDPNPGFYKCEDSLFRRRHPSVPCLQLIVIRYSLRRRLCTTAHRYKLATPPTIDPLLIYDGRWCHLCCPRLQSLSKNRVYLRKQASSPKSFP